VADKKIQWGMILGGALAAAVLTALVIWLLGGLGPREGREARAALIAFFRELPPGTGRGRPGAPVSSNRGLTDQWRALARHGDLKAVYERGAWAAAFLVVPADKMPGVKLADIKRRLDRHLRLLGKTPRRSGWPEPPGRSMDLIGWAAREAKRGRVVVFIRLRRIAGGWRVIYPSGLLVVGSQ